MLLLSDDLMKMIWRRRRRGVSDSDLGFSVDERKREKRRGGEEFGR